MQFLFTINTNISWLLLKRGSVNKKIRMAEQPHSVEKVHDGVYMLREVFYESLLFSFLLLLLLFGVIYPYHISYESGVLLRLNSRIFYISFHFSTKLAR